MTDARRERELRTLAALQARAADAMPLPAEMLDRLAPKPILTKKERAARKQAHWRHQAAKRHASKLQRTPPWADLDAIRALHVEAQRLTRATGASHPALLPNGGDTMSQDIDALGESLTAAQTADRFTAYAPANVRARFEAHAHDECLLITRNADGAYAECDTRAAWIAWCAALGVESAQVAPAALTDERIRELGGTAFGIDIAFDGSLMKFARSVELAALAAEPVRPQEPLPPGFDRASLMDLADWLAEHDKTINPTPPRAGTMTSLAYAEAFIRAALAVKPQEPAAMRLLDRDAPTVSQNELRRMLDGLDASAKSFGLVLMTDFKGCLSLAMLDAAPKAVKPSKVQIRYERSGRCFWHDNCAAASGPGRSMMKPERHGDKHSLIRCVQCGAAGWYPVGRVGDVACDPEALKPSPAQGEQGVLEGTDRTTSGAIGQP